MTHKIPTGLVAAEQQPPVVEIHMADEVFIKQMLIAKAGTFIPQHTHTYDHTSMLAVGRVRVWAGDAEPHDYTAPTGFLIAAGVKHTFLALEDNTIVYCIHNVSRTGEVDILDEHSIVGEL